MQSLEGSAVVSAEKSERVSQKLNAAPHPMNIKKNNKRFELVFFDLTGAFRSGGGVMLLDNKLNLFNMSWRNGDDALLGDSWFFGMRVALLFQGFTIPLEGCALTKPFSQKDSIAYVKTCNKLLWSQYKTYCKTKESVWLH